MTTPTNNNNDSGFAGPVVEIWVEDHADGSQSVIVAGERGDGQRFFGSFFQPTIDETVFDHPGEVS